jgi:hypothetical protein
MSGVPTTGYLAAITESGFYQLITNRGMEIREKLLFAVAPFAVSALTYLFAPLWLFGLIAAIWLIVGLIVVFLGRKKWVLILPIAVLIWALLSFAFISAMPCPFSCHYDARRISDLRQIQNALDRYFNKCGVYPGGVPKPSSDPRCAGVSRPSQLVGPLPDISNIPRDPITEVDYSYCFTADGASYALQANLQDTQYPALVQALAAPPAGCTDTVGAVTCDKSKGEYCVSP